MTTRRLKVELFLLTAICFFVISCSAKNLIVNTNKLPKTTGKKNVILITISSLRADHVSCLDYDRDTTPNFDKFAKKNILFTNAFATSSWMMPSAGSIFTSSYPNNHGATHISKNLGSEHYTLAEILNEYNYYTVGFCCNPRLSSEDGFGQGFDFYDDYSASMMLSSMSFGREDSVDINKKRTNDLINDAAIRWLQKNTHKPFFLFVHFYDNHWDYLPPFPYNTLYDPNYKGFIDGTEIAREPLYSNKPSDEDTEHIIALYDGEIKQTDSDLGELLRFLEETGQLENSIVIICGEHGEQFYEHGHTSHHGIFEEMIHIPLAVSLPQSTKVKTIDSLVSGVDILPTILDLLDVAVPVGCQGKSIRPLIDGKKERINDFIIAEYTGGAVPNALAIRFERFKFVQQENKVFAYDLSEDTLEQKKIYQHDFTGQMNQKFETIKNYMTLEVQK